MILTAPERRRALAAGSLSLAGLSLFIGVAVAMLLVWGAGQTGGAEQTAGGGTASGRLWSAYTGRILVFTLWQATLSTVLSVALALPVALALARRPAFFGRVWIVRLMAIPMGLPVLIGALGLIGIWGRQGVINSVLLQLGMTQPIAIYGLSGILLAHVFFNLPLAARLMLAALERLPAEYWSLSASLGMRSLSVLRFVEWPTVRAVIPGVAGLIFMLCATSFTLVLVLGGGPAATTLEVAIYQSLHFDFDPPRAIALSLVQIALTGLVMAALACLARPQETIATTGGTPRRFDGRKLGSRLWDCGTIALATLFLILPLASIVGAGLDADLARLAGSAVFLKATRTSLTIALYAGVIAVLLAVSAIRARQAVADMQAPPFPARVLARLLGAGSSLVLLVPPVVLGTGWFLALRGAGIDMAQLAPALVAIVNAMMALPFVFRVLEPAMDIHRHRSGRLAASLGLSGFARLKLIDLPVLAAPLLTALSFAMALSLGDLGAVALFGSDELATLPFLVYSRMSSYRTHDADGLALLMGFLCLVLTTIGTLANAYGREQAAGERR